MLGRTGLDDPLGVVPRVLALGLLLLSLPVACIRLLRRRSLEHPPPGQVASLLLLPLLGASLLGLLFAERGWLVALVLVAGPALFATHVLRWARDAQLKEALFLLVVSTAISLWMSGVAWGLGCQNPLFLEGLALGAPGKYAVDTLFHSAVGNMLAVHGSPSTGLDGIPWLHYHFGSHWIFAQLSKALGIHVLDFYLAGFPIVFLPLFLAGLLWFAVALKTTTARGATETRSLRKQRLLWLVLLLGIVGFVPLDAQDRVDIGWWRLASESHAVAMLLAFCLLARLLGLVARPDWAAPMMRPQGMLGPVLLLPLIVGVIGLTKLSVMYGLAAGGGYAFVRLGLFRNGVWRLAFVATVGVCGLTCLVVSVPGFVEVSLLNSVMKYVHPQWFGPWIVLQFCWLWVLVLDRLRSLGASTLGDVLLALRAKSLIDLEILAVVAMAGSLPELFLSFPGRTGGFFLDPQRWFGLALVLGRLGSSPGWARLDLPVRGPVLRLSMRVVAMCLLLTVPSAIAVANLTSVFRMFTKATADIRGAIVRLVEEGRAANPGLSRALETRPGYGVVVALRSLSKMPVATRRRTALFIPRTNGAYWHLLDSCAASPLVAPALAGVPLIGGLPDPSCERFYGYWAYGHRSDPVVDEGTACRRATQLGFEQIIVFRDLSQGQLSMQTKECGGSS